MGRRRDPDIKPGSRSARGHTLVNPTPPPSNRVEQLLAQLTARGQEPWARKDGVMNPRGRLDAFLRSERVDRPESPVARAYGNAYARATMGIREPML